MPRNWKYKVAKRTPAPGGTFAFPTAATFATEAEAVDYACSFAAEQARAGYTAGTYVVHTRRAWERRGRRVNDLAYVTVAGAGIRISYHRDERGPVVHHRPVDSPHGEDVPCECGEWSGESCQWQGSPSGMICVEFVPDWLRGTHEAAGGAGSYPHNGAIRVKVSAQCARLMTDTDGEWCSMV